MENYLTSLNSLIYWKPSNKFIYQAVKGMEYTCILRLSNKNAPKKGQANISSKT